MTMGQDSKKQPKILNKKSKNIKFMKTVKLGETSWNFLQKAKYLQLLFLMANFEQALEKFTTFCYCRLHKW